MKIIVHLSMMVLLYGLFVVGCSNVDELVNSSGKSDDAEHHPEDSGKPSEQSEGIPGYLVDPKMVSFFENSGEKTITILAPPGTVQSDVGPVEQVVVRIGHFNAADVSKAITAAEAGGSVLINAIQAEKVVVQPYGAFVGTVPADVGDLLIVNLLPFADLNAFELVQNEERDSAVIYSVGSPPKADSAGDDEGFGGLFGGSWTFGDSFVFSDGDDSPPVDGDDDFQASMCRDFILMYLDMATMLTDSPGTCSVDADCYVEVAKPHSGCEFHYYASKKSFIFSPMMSQLDMAKGRISSSCSAEHLVCPATGGIEASQGPNVVCNTQTLRCVDATSL